LQLFRDMVSGCRARGVNLIVFIPPVHALQLEAIRVARLWPVFEQWKRDLAQLVATEDPSVLLWDFSGYTGPRAESVPPNGDKTTRMKWYIDSSHFTPAFGHLVLEQALASSPRSGDAPAQFLGVLLKSDSVGNDLNDIRRDRDSYAASHSEEVTWVTELAARAKKHTKRAKRRRS
jgi:hypothetical protein